MRYRQKARSIHGEDTKPWMYIQYSSYSNTYSFPISTHRLEQRLTRYVMHSHSKFFILNVTVCQQRFEIEHRVSFVPRPSPPLVFDHLQNTLTLLSLFLHTASNQKLEAGKVSEQD